MNIKAWHLYQKQTKSRVNWTFTRDFAFKKTIKSGQEANCCRGASAARLKLALL